ncbi:hypothetical protein SLE2022_292200 [Rubroshorea leprosula]
MYQFSIAFFQFLMVRSGCSSISNMPTILSKVTDLPPEIQTTITKKALASLAKDQMTQFEAVFHRRHGDQVLIPDKIHPEYPYMTVLKPLLYSFSESLAATL